jgi:hypothetical protein
MTKVCILNDTSRFHFGSATVMQQIFRSMENLDWQILASFFGNSFMFDRAEPLLDESLLERADVLVINGEGSIHHDSTMSLYLLDTIEKYRHKKICLVNTLWQEMSAASEEKLQHADLVIARDHESHRALSGFYRGSLHLAPDFSSRDIPPPVPMQDQGIVFGGFYWNQHAKTAGIAKSSIALRDMAETSVIDITRENWHVTVNKLRNAKLLVTGKFHEVMAANVARCPFLFCPVTTHKIELIGEFSGMRLKPLDLNLDKTRLSEAFEQAIADTDHFNRVFDGINSAAAAFPLERVLKSVLD